MVKNSDENVELAPLFKRVLAYTFDIVLYSIIAVVFLFFSKSFIIINDFKKSFFMIVCLIIISFFMFSYMPKKTKGQTIGKKIFRIALKDFDGNDNISYFKYFLREFIAKISMVFFIIPMSLVHFFVLLVMNKSLPKSFLIDQLFSTKVIVLKNRNKLIF